MDTRAGPVDRYRASFLLKAFVVDRSIAGAVQYLIRNLTRLANSARMIDPAVTARSLAEELASIHAALAVIGTLAATRHCTMKTITVTTFIQLP